MGGFLCVSLKTPQNVIVELGYEGSFFHLSPLDLKGIHYWKYALFFARGLERLEVLEVMFNLSWPYLRWYRHKPRALVLWVTG